MFKSILIPTDGSPLAEKAFIPAIEVAKANNGRLVGISVATPYTRPQRAEGSPIPDYSKEYEQQTLSLAQQYVQRLADTAREQGVPCEILTPCSAEPSSEIIAAIHRFGCDVIFIASHGHRGIRRILLGSETQRVLAESPVPVMIFP